MTAPEWFNSPQPPFFDSIHRHNLYLTPLVLRAAKGEGPYPTQMSRDGEVKIPPKQIVDDWCSILNGQVIYRTVVDKLSGNLGRYVIATAQGAVELGVRANNRLDVDLLHTDPRVVEAADKWCAEHILPDNPDAGPIYTLIQSNSLRVQRVGKAGLPLTEENYTPAVVEQVRALHRDLSSNNPKGRLAVLTGPGGSGKTHLVQYLATAPETMFVLISSSLMDTISGPNILPALISAREDYGEGKSMVLILEDGEHALLPRNGSGNDSAVSNLLNMSEGILGKMLDLRIVVTSNARKIKMDDAVTRPGRISYHIEVGELPVDQCRTILERLDPKIASLFKGDRPHVLGELYALAKAGGWLPPKKADTPLGFHPKQVERTRLL